MTTTQLREKAADLKGITVDYRKGEITFTKLDFCLIGAICFLAGLCIGMIAAPLTHGIHLFSNNTISGNGSKNGNNYGDQYGGREDSETV